MRKKQAYDWADTGVDYGLLQAPGNPHYESTARRFLGAICDGGFGVRSDYAPLGGHARVDSLVASQAIPAFLPGAKGLGTYNGGPSVTYVARGLATI
jgi:hypothetical protein